MLWEVFLATLTSIGGAAIVVGGLAAFLGKVWADRIKQSTLAAFQSELATLSAKQTLALELFKTKASAALAEREAFTGFSAEFYQDFLVKRVAVYRKLLLVENKYRKDMASFIRHEFEDWHERYVSVYNELRDLVVINQLYISNAAELTFRDLQREVAPHLAEADRAEAFAVGADVDPEAVIDARRRYEQSAFSETSSLMEAFFEQVRKDVEKVRARIEMDSPVPLS